MYSARSLSGNNPVPGATRRQDRPSLASVLLATATPPASRRRRAAPAWLIGVAFCLCAAHAPGAEVFKWKDADGHVHFGDRPPDKATETVTIRSGPSAAANGNHQERLRQVLDGYTKEREAREASRANEKLEAEKREQLCIRAKARQHTAENANFLYDYTPSGERRVLDGAEYKHAMEKARQAVADSCD